jgi:hypothetical protein
MAELTLENFSSWPESAQRKHLRRCCKICRDPETIYEMMMGRCDGCGKQGCSNCIRGCGECLADFGPPDCECDHEAPENRWGCNCQRSAREYCEDCRHGILHAVPCGKVICSKHLKWHDDTVEACERYGCSECILHHRNVRDTLVREVERNLLLGAKGRAAPAKDAPMATVVLHQLVRSGQEPMASIVLDFVGGRRDGPRRKAKLRAKLRARKDTRGKAPRKQLAVQLHMRRRVVDGLL